MTVSRAFQIHPIVRSKWGEERRRSWARLLRKISVIDPLSCPCGGSLRIIAVIEQPQSIRQILAHLKLGQRPQRALPPRPFPQKLESFLAELSPQQAQAVRASNDSLFWDEVAKLVRLKSSNSSVGFPYPCVCSSLPDRPFQVFSLPLPPKSHDRDPVAPHRSPHSPHFSPFSIDFTLFLGLHLQGKFILMTYGRSMPNGCPPGRFYPTG